MILETDIMLKHVGINTSFIERPDLKHTDSSVIYLPYRVCEDCYLLFETMNEVKNSQIEIANYFNIPVNHLNFGVEIYSKPETEDNLEELLFMKTSNNLNSTEKNKNINLNTNVTSNNQFGGNYQSSQYKTNPENYTNNTNLTHSSVGNNGIIDHNLIHKNSCQSKERKNFLYRFLIMFTDILWNENITIPNEKLYIVFNIFGNWYKLKLNDHYPSIDYSNINFFKMFYVICEENYGFIDYIDKNRQMLVKIGHFIENPEKQKDLDLAKIFKRNIIIEDLDICNNIDEFVNFCSVELSLNAVRYADKYRNTLNGLLFKEDKPHYVGKLRCLIRVNKEKEIDVEKIICRQHFNVRS